MTIEAATPVERLVKSADRVRDLGEVFTPAATVNAMLDLLPHETWEVESSATFLEPACGDGNFLVAVLDRKLDEVVRAYRNGEFRGGSNASVFTRHALDALASIHAIDISSDNIVGGTPGHAIGARGRLLTRFAERLGAELAELLTDDDVLRAAEAIVNRNVRVGDMLVASAADWGQGSVDVIVGNPPYQMVDGGPGGSAAPIYQQFIEKAIALNPRYIVMIVPSRWFVGGKGLGHFRTKMLSDKRLATIVDYQDARALFPSINLNGGVHYFLWDRDADGPCTVTSMHKSGRKSMVERELNAYDVLLRLNEAVPILDKVRKQSEPTFDALVSSLKPFGFRTYFHGVATKPAKDPVLLYGHKATSWLTRSEVEVNAQWIDEWKVLIPRGTDGNENYPLPVLTTPLVVGPETACTETYLVIGPCSSQQEAENLAAYMQTRFFRFLLSLRKHTQDNSRDKFSFIPDLDLGQVWTDRALYARYGITEDEQAFIAEQIKAVPPRAVNDVQRARLEAGRGLC